MTEIELLVAGVVLGLLIGDWIDGFGPRRRQR
jgi:hypothetical protein